MKNRFMPFIFLLLSACVGRPENSPPVVAYDFGLPAARLVEDGAWARLALEVKSPAWLNSSRVDYRLAYEDPLKRRDYVGSRWVGTPASLIEQRLVQQIGGVNASGNASFDCLLRVELQEFSQVFDSFQQSRGVLQSQVSLIDKKRIVLAQRQFSIEKAAVSADAHGGVVALVETSAAFSRQLVGWLDDLQDATKACRQTAHRVGNPARVMH